MQRVQVNVATKLFRETDAIALAKKVLPSSKEIKILSFGCSIGDEIATLRTFFPSAKLFGCDIDLKALSTAQATIGHFADIFLSSEDEITKHRPYDLICALSSLCIYPLPPKLEVFHQKFPFSRFDEIVSFLDSCLDTDGLFVIKNSSYPFALSAVSDHYVSIRSDNIYQNSYVPMFNKNFALSVVNVPPPSYAFKVEDISGLSDWDFIDCVYQKCKLKSPHQVPRVINSPLETPRLELNQIASWTRSNLDTWTNGNPNNLIEVKKVFSVSQAKEYPEQVYVECKTSRSSIYGGEIIQIGRRGWWMDISSLNGDVWYA